MPKTKYVADWLERAAEDIQASELIFREHGPLGLVCFHCQQAAEKYFKALLAFNGKHTRKIHDLESLLNECIQLNDSLDQLEAETRYLSQFYIETRYPGDIPEFFETDAQKALESARQIRDVISQIIE